MSSRLKILHLILGLTETNGQYNEHCLPMATRRNISICTFFRSKLTPPPEIKLFGGNDKIFGFVGTFRKAVLADEYDAIHAHVPHMGVLLLFATVLCGLWSKVMPISVYTVQNSYPNYKLRNRLLMLPVFLFFRELVFCSHACLDSFPWIYKALGGDRMHVVQNAVDMDRIDAVLTRTGSLPALPSFRIASVGRLIEIKNPFTLLKAFSMSDDDQTNELVFLGEGNLRTELTKKIVEAGAAERVHLAGLVSRDDVFSHVVQADLFVSTSRGEGLPVAVIEVMSCRCPVILSDIEPHREIAEGVDFIPLIDPDDVDGFAREIRRFQEMSESERKQIGEQCRQLVQKRFGLETMHSRLDQVYARLPKRPQSPIGSQQVA